MFPEELARQQIDRQLIECGWLVQDRRAMSITAGLGVAVREVTLGTGEADYLLFVDGKVAGVIEAKPPGFSLTTAETQSQKYQSGLHARFPHYRLPLPFEYRSDGTTTVFTNGRRISRPPESALLPSSESGWTLPRTTLRAA